VENFNRVILVTGYRGEIHSLIPVPDWITEKDIQPVIDTAAGYDQKAEFRMLAHPCFTIDDLVERIDELNGITPGKIDSDAEENDDVAEPDAS
jgi:hypothetical protein